MRGHVSRFRFVPPVVSAASTVAPAANGSLERFGRPDLTQTYVERLPAPSLADLVTSVWLLEVAPDGPAYEHRTVPNGSVELSYALGAAVVEVTGPQHEPTVGQLGPGTTVVGMRLRPGAAPSILGQPASEVADRHVELDDLWDSRTLAGRLAEATSPAEAARLLEDEVLSRAAFAPEPDPLVHAAVDRLQPWVPARVGESAAGLFISPRQLRRRFAAALGLGPKTVQRILRFQGFLALTQGRHDHDVSLVRLAHEAGYADQAHLTRESSELTGLTPKAFLEEMWRSCGPNHDHDVSYAGLRRRLRAAHVA
jgi:AraC-like DNA-binding protein